MNYPISPEALQRAAEILKAIAHPIRLQIIQVLETGEKNVKEIQTILGQPQAVTSQHLNLLRVRGLLQARRQGTLVFYSIANPLLLQILNCLRKSLSQHPEH